MEGAVEMVEVATSRRQALVAEEAGGREADGDLAKVGEARGD